MQRKAHNQLLQQSMKDAINSNIQLIHRSKREGVIKTKLEKDVGRSVIPLGLEEYVATAEIARAA